MASSLLLDRSLWDLTLDADGNIALASEPYSLSQDAASVIRTYLGECYWDTTLGLPYLTQIFGKTPAIALLKQLLIDAAETVPGVASAACFFTGINSRTVGGQVQVTSQATGQVSVATFEVSNPQGVG